MFSWVVEDMSAVGPEIKKLPRGAWLRHATASLYIAVWMALSVGASIRMAHSLPCAAEGLSAIAVSPTRPMLVSISQKGGLYMHRETFSTTFPVRSAEFDTSRWLSHWDGR